MDNENSEKDKVFELERQLHEQYANNSNAHFKSFITFATAMFALFGAYGWAYIHTPRISSIRIDEWPVVLENKLSYDAFLLLAIVVVGSLCILSAICVFLGYAERRDQMEVRIIRDKYMVKTVYSTPFERGYFCYLASYYCVFYCALLCCQAFVILTSTIKCRPCCGTFSNIAYIVMASFVVISVWVKIRYYRNYKRYDVRYNSKPKYKKSEVAKYIVWDKKNENKRYYILSDGDKYYKCKILNELPPKELNGEVSNPIVDERFGIESVSGLFYYLFYTDCLVMHIVRGLLFVISVAVIYFLTYLSSLVIYNII